MTLYQIEYFRAVCRTGSVTEASIEMHVSQPVISATIKSLEEECGVLLFHRYKRRLSLTKEGEKLLAAAEEIAMRAKALALRMEDLRKERRPVTVGVSPMVGGTYFPEFLKAFKKDCPEIEVVVEERRSLHSIGMIRKENMDLAFGLIKYEEPEDINVCLLKKTRFALAVSPRHPLAGRETVSFAELTGVPMAVYKDNSSLIKRMRQSGAKPDIFVAVDQIYTMRSYALSGMAATILLEDMIGQEEGLTGIALEPEMEANVGLMWKRDHFLHYNAMALIEYAKSFFRE